MRDWRNRDDYRFTTSLKPWGWAWQFLRRNPEYQADFKAALDRFWAREDEYSQVVAARRGTDFQPESIPNAECRRKWFIWYYLDPEIEAPNPDPFVGFVDLYMSNTHLWPLRPQEAVIRLDLELPLDPQLKLAQSVLRTRQQNMAKRGDIKLRRPRNWRKKWLTYLRLLDGKQAGALHRELAAVLPPRRATHPYSSPKKRVSYQLEQARRMCHEGYRDILLIS